MRHLTRSPEPAILAQKKAEWLKKHLERLQADPKRRPDSAKYAHDDIKTELERMSSFKCFYCEANLKQESAEVDHYVEAAAKPDLSFEWGNLYLSCHGCNNGKAPDTAIPVANCVNPCDPAHRPEEHLTFHGDCIAPVPGSALGSNTIRKYRLDRPELDLKRARRLRELLEAMNGITQRLNREKRTKMNEFEQEFLQAYAEETSAYSLACRIYLEMRGI